MVDGGRGFRFKVMQAGQALPAFIIRYRGQVHAYLNQCGHQSVELDWSQGEFFDVEKTRLICATHGARYAPDSGACVTGRCNGRGLTKIGLNEQDGNIYLKNQDDLHLISSLFDSD